MRLARGRKDAGCSSGPAVFAPGPLMWAAPASRARTGKCRLTEKIAVANDWKGRRQGGHRKIGAFIYLFVNCTLQALSTERPSERRNRSQRAFFQTPAGFSRPDGIRIGPNRRDPRPPDPPRPPRPLPSAAVPTASPGKRRGAGLLWKPAPRLGVLSWRPA